VAKCFNRGGRCVFVFAFVSGTAGESDDDDVIGEWIRVAWRADSPSDWKRLREWTRRRENVHGLLLGAC
jgi:hypothetical protein